MKNELVQIKKGQVLSDSLIFAEEFGIAHIHILEKIRNLIIDTPIVKSMFIQTTYKNDRNRTYPMYFMNRDGYMFLVMNVANKKANEKKIRFIQAFNAMEQALLNQQNASWLESRDIGKQARLELADTIKDFVEYATNQGCSQSKFYYSNITKMTYKALELIDSNKSTPIRDMLTGMELGFLMVAEKIAEKALKEGMDKEMKYHDIYYYAKEKVSIFAQSVIIKERKQLK